MNRLLAILIVGAVSASPHVLSLRAADSLPTLVLAPPAAPENSSFVSKRWVGVAGCTATSCHGGRSVVGGEASAWFARDAAHRRAYDVLFNETSQRIARNLGLKVAHTEARCLACHSTDVSQAETVSGDRFAVEYGVGCESCHGAAGEWISRHTQRSWRSMPTQDRAALGFRDLRSLTARAETCVACHVGSPRATVDHDLIAAGHPRLTFEMSAYHALLPKHWDAAAETRADRTQDVRLWAIGHGISAKAIADIATARAESAIKSGARDAVSDLAEFDCQACHHDLADESWRGRAELRGRLGQPSWGSWSVNSANWVARESVRTFAVDGSAVEASMDQLVAFMQRSRLGGVPAEQLSQASRQVSIDLAAWSRSLESSSIDAAKLNDVLQHLLSDDSGWGLTWDGQTQRFLGVVAIRSSLRDLTARDPFDDASQLRLLQSQLRFPNNYATPHAFDPKKSEQVFQELLRTTKSRTRLTN